MVLPHWIQCKSLSWSRYIQPLHLGHSVTDLSLFVTKGRKEINPVIYMNSIDELNYIKNNNKYIEVGATTSLTSLSLT